MNELTKPGFYWVKFKSPYEYIGWTIVQVFENDEDLGLMCTDETATFDEIATWGPRIPDYNDEISNLQSE